MGIKVLITIFMLMLLGIAAFSGVMVGRLCDQTSEAFMATIFTFMFMLTSYLLYNAGLVYITL